MKIQVANYLTYEGLTYEPGREYEVGEALLAGLKHNFKRAIIEPPAEPFSCGYPTFDGSPCQRHVNAPGERCWQHREE